MGRFGQLSLICLVLVTVPCCLSFEAGYHYDLAKQVTSWEGFSDDASEIAGLQSLLISSLPQSDLAQDEVYQAIHKLEFANLFDQEQVAGYWDAFLHALSKGLQKLKVEEGKEIEAVQKLAGYIGLASFATQNFYSASTWVDVLSVKNCKRDLLSQTWAQFSSTTLRQQNMYKDRMASLVTGADSVTALSPAFAQFKSSRPELTHRLGQQCQSGINKFSSEREGFEHAYSAAFVASREVIRTCRMWLGNDDLWELLSQFEMSFEQRETLIRNVRTLRNLKEFQTTYEHENGQPIITNGDWKGTGSGDAHLYQVARNAATEMFAATDDPRSFVAWLATGLQSTLPSLTSTLVDGSDGSFALRQHPSYVGTELVSLSDADKRAVRAVMVKLPKVTFNTENLGTSTSRSDSLSNLYLDVEIGETTFHEPTVWNEYSFWPSWNTISFVPVTDYADVTLSMKTRSPVTEVAGGASKIIQDGSDVDINKFSGANHLRMSVWIGAESEFYYQATDVLAEGQSLVPIEAGMFRGICPSVVDAKGNPCNCTSWESKTCPAIGARYGDVISWDDNVYGTEGFAAHVSLRVKVFTLEDAYHWTNIAHDDFSSVCRAQYYLADSADAQEKQVCEVIREYSETYKVGYSSESTEQVANPTALKMRVEQRYINRGKRPEYSISGGLIALIIFIPLVLFITTVFCANRAKNNTISVPNLGILIPKCFNSVVKFTRIRDLGCWSWCSGFSCELSILWRPCLQGCGALMACIRGGPNANPGGNSQGRSLIRNQF